MVSLQINSLINVDTGVVKTIFHSLHNMKIYIKQLLEIIGKHQITYTNILTFYFNKHFYFNIDRSMYTNISAEKIFNLKLNVIAFKNFQKLSKKPTILQYLIITSYSKI